MIRNSISQLEKQGAINCAAIINHIKKFYSNWLDYLEEWTVNDNDIEHFHLIEMETNHVPYSNSLNIAEYALSSPGTNAATEPVFSTVNKMWPSEKSELA